MWKWQLESKWLVGNFKLPNWRNQYVKCSVVSCEVLTCLPYSQLITFWYCACSMKQVLMMSLGDVWAQTQSDRVRINLTPRSTLPQHANPQPSKTLFKPTSSLCKYLPVPGRKSSRTDGKWLHFGDVLKTFSQFPLNAANSFQLGQAVWLSNVYLKVDMYLTNGP